MTASAHATLGSRGLRSHSTPARPVPEPPEPPPASVSVPTPLAAHRHGGWMGTLVGMAAGALIGGALFVGLGDGLGGKGLDLPHRLVLGAGIVYFITLFRRRRAALAPSGDVVARPTVADHPGDDSGLDRGVRDIRRTDAKFDPARFAGYAGMVFRATHTAWMSRDVGALRDQVTPEMYGELQAQCDGLRSTRRSNHVDRIEIQAEITEAWQESGRDYVTAYIDGSLLDYTLDEATDALVDGSRTIVKAVEEFWTFTRPAGLNPWMLSAIQTS